jgi:hypothetical protein
LSAENAGDRPVAAAHSSSVRRLFVAVVLLSACAPTPSSPATAPLPTAAVAGIAELPAESLVPERDGRFAIPRPTVRTEPPAPTRSPNAAPVHFGPDPVKVVVSRGPIATSPVPALRDGASDSLMASGMFGWVQMYLESIERFSTPASDYEVREQTLQRLIDDPYRTIVEAMYSPARGERTFTLRGVSIEHTYRNWYGAVEYHDIRIRYVEAPGDVDRDVTLRIAQVNGNVKVIDAFDTSAQRWLIGEASRHSALALEAEAPTAIEPYFEAEVYRGEMPPAWQRDDTPFNRERMAALNRIDSEMRASGVEWRGFEGLTARIIRFDPISFLGDGIVTVRVTGTSVAAGSTGIARTDVSRTLRFLRMSSGSWAAVDEQRADGSWFSSGDLALATVTAPHG